MFIANGNTNKVVKESKDDVLMKRRRGSNVMQLLQGGRQEVLGLFGNHNTVFTTSVLNSTSAKWIISLELRDCGLTSGDIVKHCVNLRALYLPKNKMTSVPFCLGQLKKLQILDMSYNIVDNFRQLSALQQKNKSLGDDDDDVMCVVTIQSIKLQCLSFIGNPVVQVPEYRKHIINMLPGLDCLDGIVVSTWEFDPKFSMYYGALPVPPELRLFQERKKIHISSIINAQTRMMQFLSGRVKQRIFLVQKYVRNFLIHTRTKYLASIAPKLQALARGVLLRQHLRKSMRALTIAAGIDLNASDEAFFSGLESQFDTDYHRRDYYARLIQHEYRLYSKWKRKHVAAIAIQDFVRFHMKCWNVTKQWIELMNTRSMVVIIDLKDVVMSCMHLLQVRGYSFPDFQISTMDKLLLHQSPIVDIRGITHIQNIFIHQSSSRISKRSATNLLYEYANPSQRKALSSSPRVGCSVTLLERTRLTSPALQYYFSTYIRNCSILIDVYTSDKDSLQMLYCAVTQRLKKMPPLHQPLLPKWDKALDQHLMVLAVQRLWRGYMCRKYTMTIVIDKAISLRRCVYIQRWWRKLQGITRRMKLLARTATACREIITPSIYLDAWIFYVLIRQTSLPKLSSDVCQYPEFMGVPSLDLNGHAVFYPCLPPPSITIPNENVPPAVATADTTTTTTNNNNNNMRSHIPPIIPPPPMSIISEESIRRQDSVNGGEVINQQQQPLDILSEKGPAETSPRSSSQQQGVGSGSVPPIASLDMNLLELQKPELPQIRRVGFPKWMSWAPKNVKTEIKDRYSFKRALYDIISGQCSIAVKFVRPSLPEYAKHYIRVIELKYATVAEARARASAIMNLTYDPRFQTCVEPMSAKSLGDIVNIHRKEIATEMYHTTQGGKRDAIIVPLEIRVRLQHVPQWILEIPRTDDDIYRCRFLLETLTLHYTTFSKSSNDDIASNKGAPDISKEFSTKEQYSKPIALFPRSQSIEVASQRSLSFFEAVGPSFVAMDESGSLIVEDMFTNSGGGSSIVLDPEKMLKEVGIFMQSIDENNSQLNETLPMIVDVVASARGQGGKDKDVAPPPRGNLFPTLPSEFVDKRHCARHIWSAQRAVLWCSLAITDHSKVKATYTVGRERLYSNNILKSTGTGCVTSRLRSFEVARDGATLENLKRDKDERSKKVSEELASNLRTKSDQFSRMDGEKNYDIDSDLLDNKGISARERLQINKSRQVKSMKNAKVEQKEEFHYLQAQHALERVEMRTAAEEKWRKKIDKLWGVSGANNYSAIVSRDAHEHNNNGLANSSDRPHTASSHLVALSEVESKSQVEASNVQESQYGQYEVSASTYTPTDAVPSVATNIDFVGPGPTPSLAIPTNVPNKSPRRSFDGTATIAPTATAAAREELGLRVLEEKQNRISMIKRKKEKVNKLKRAKEQAKMIGKAQGMIFSALAGRLETQSLLKAQQHDLAHRKDKILSSRDGGGGGGVVVEEVRNREVTWEDVEGGGGVGESGHIKHTSLDFIAPQPRLPPHPRSSSSKTRNMNDETTLYDANRRLVNSPFTPRTPVAVAVNRLQPDAIHLPHPVQLHYPPGSAYIKTFGGTTELRLTIDMLDMDLD